MTALRLLAVLAVATIPATVSAHVLEEPNPVDRVMDISQFGFRQDSKFIFCEGEDCPSRTLKQIAPPALAPRVVPIPLPAVAPVPEPQSIQPPEQLVSEKKPEPVAVKAKKHRAKKKIKYQCVPVGKDKK